MKGSLTVYYEDPFWVGLFEETDDDALYKCCRVVFGEEPTGPELFDFIRKRYSQLSFTSVPLEEAEERKKTNPKRLAREINRQMNEFPRLNKAYEVIRLGYEQKKDLLRKADRERREIEEEKDFRLRCEKRKKKHRGH